VLKFRDLVNFVRFGRDGKRLYVGVGETLQVYRFNRNLLEKVATLETDTRRYSNAKVVLVGESMAGKTHLAHRLIEDKWVPGESTHGMRVWPLNIATVRDEGTEREVWLWDLAGQPDYRLIHQIFLDETSLALVVFDPSSEDAFQKIKHWEMALRQAVGHDPAKILVAPKDDVSSLTTTRDKVDQLMEERGYAAFVQTSAFTGRGRAELLSAISEAIPWDRTPSITTPRLFKVLKDGIVQIKDQGLVMIQFAALKQQLQLANPKERFDDTDLRTVVRLLAGQGLIKPLKFGDVILIKPELMNNYAAVVARAAREHPEGIGCIEERAVLSGDFEFHGMARVSRFDEDILLRAAVETFIDQSLCIRQATSGGDVLVFPAHYNLEPEIGDQPPDLVLYRFAGNLANIYTTLVVRLRYTRGFEEPALYKNAAMFRTNEGHRLGFSFQADSQGTGTLKIFFDTAVAEDTRVTFLRYIHEHLLKHAIDVVRQRQYACPNIKCGRPFEALEAVRVRMAAGESYIRCVFCDAQIPIFDLVERKFREDRFQRKVQEMDVQASIRLGTEGKELLLIGHAFAAAAEANQIFRPIANSDHGIDGEIEFRNDRGEASGQKVYLQLKSGDSYAYERVGDGCEIFTVKKRRHLQYWQDHAYPVFLVVRDGGGTARWMNVTSYLRNRKSKDSLQIEFDGEPFDAYSILRLATMTIS
jgi:small GTP-binding protein